MKICVACNGTQVTHHFGHCETFRFYEAENNVLVSETSLANPGHKPGFLPNFLGDLGVNVIIAGSMGGGAADIFQERAITVITGAEGDARTAAEKYLQGVLVSTGAICHEHHHHGHEHEGEGHEHRHQGGCNQ